MPRSWATEINRTLAVRSMSEKQNEYINFEHNQYGPV